MGAKYELTDETIEFNDRVLHRIRSLKSFGNVTKGDLGGYVESEDNLSQIGYAWIYGYAKIYDNAIVSGDAKVYDNAIVSGDAWIFDNAWIYDNAIVSGDAWVYDNARVYNDARICGGAHVYGDAKVYYRQKVTYGGLKIDVFKTKNWAQALYNLYGIYPINNKVTLYKRIRNDWCSFHDATFKYPKQGFVEATNYNVDIQESCAKGLHFADPDYWNGGGTILIAAEIELNEIITIQDGKVRCKKAYILGEIENRR